jgi:hypothetical protein
MSENIKDVIRTEIVNIIEQARVSFADVKNFALDEVWKILQLLTAVVIQLIEELGKDLSSPEKKEFALELIESFYDNVFVHVDIPFLPSVVETVLHSHIKKVIMMLVSSGIDAMVATFRQVGVFKPKTPVTIESNTTTESKIIIDFLNDLKNIARK